MNFGGVDEEVVTRKRVFTRKSKTSIKRGNNSRNRLWSTRTWAGSKPKREWF